MAYKKFTPSTPIPIIFSMLKCTASRQQAWQYQLTPGNAQRRTSKLQIKTAWSVSLMRIVIVSKYTLG